MHICAFIFAMGLLIVGCIFIDLYGKSKEAKIENEVTIRVNRVDSSLGEYIREAMHISQTLSYVISQNEGMDNMDYVVKNLIGSYERNFTVEIAPEGIIKKVYPENNENKNTLNKNMYTDGKFLEERRIATIGENIYVSNMLDLFNGKTGLIARSKVYINTSEGQKFWGYVNCLMEEKDIKKVIYNTIRDEYDYEIFYENKGEKEVLISNSLDEIEDLKTFKVNIPNGNWKIGIDEDSIKRKTSYVGLYRLILMLFCIFSYFMFIFIMDRSVLLRSQVDEIRKTKSDVEKMKEKYRSFFKMSPDYIFIIDYNTREIIEANDAFLKNIGTVDKEDENIKLLSKDDIIGRIMKTHDSRGIEFNILAKNGKYKEIEVKSTILKDEKTSERILCFGRDLSEKRKIEKMQVEKEEKEKRLEEFQEYDKIKTEFFANISHELRTPLNVILGSIQLISLNLKKEGDIREAVSKNNRIMRQNCYRLLRLIGNIIDLTKSASDYLHLQLRVMNIIEVVEDITMSVVDYAKVKGVEVEFDTEVEEVHLNCDPDKIERIILNILSNAIKFTGKNDKIFVNIKDFDNKIIISIRDTGIGIPQQNLKNIFTRFSQVNKSFTRENEGSGIGLSLTKSLVELHNGTIWVESIYGEGSIFFIELPKNIEESEINYDDSVPVLTERKSDLVEKINIEFSDIYFNP